MSCFSPNIAIKELQNKDGRRPNPNDSPSVALSVGPDVVNDSRSFSTAYHIPSHPNKFPRFTVNENHNGINLMCILKGNSTMDCIRFILNSSFIRSNVSFSSHKAA